jgi:uncharacterized membrane protein YqjE
LNPVAILIIAFALLLVALPLCGLVLWVVWYVVRWVSLEARRLTS